MFLDANIEGCSRAATRKPNATTAKRMCRRYARSTVPRSTRSCGATPRPRQKKERIRNLDERVAQCDQVVEAILDGKINVNDIRDA